MPISRRTLLRMAASSPLLGRATIRAEPVSTHQNSPRIVVVGAGAFGGWTALHLLRMGARVTLLDSWGPGNSRASSGGESRVIRAIYGPDRIYMELVRRSLELWKTSERAWNVRLYQRTGALWMFESDDAFARQSLDHLEELGLQVEQPSVSQISSRYPQIDFDGVRSVYLEREAGYLPARQNCARVVEQFMREGGAYVQAYVQPGPIQSGEIHYVQATTDTGPREVAADHFIFACGPWMGQLFPDVIGDRIQPTRQELFYFGPPETDRQFSEGQLPVWINFGEELFYGIPSGGRRGFKIADDTRGEPFDPTSGDRTATQQGAESARRFISRRFPGLKNAPVIESRVCQYENSPDGHFILDRHPRAENVWLVGGGSGHGYKLCPAWGEFVAERVLGRKPVDPFFALARLSA